jgi:hypothetical protein
MRAAGSVRIGRLCRAEPAGRAEEPLRLMATTTVDGLRLIQSPRPRLSERNVLAAPAARWPPPVAPFAPVLWFEFADGDYL